MGDLYKCKKCGQLCYGAAVSEVDGNLASEILTTIANDGFIEAPDSIPFLDSDFSQFLQKHVGVAAVRYDAYPAFPNVISNMRRDKVVIGTKKIEDGYVCLSCPICQSQEFFSRIGSLPTTFAEGKWDNYVDSDHTWYLLSDGNRGMGSFTELERRELTNYILQEDREDAQQIYDDIIKEGYDSVIKSKGGFAQTRDVDLTQYFRTLMNVKTDIQIMETRLFDLVLSQLPAEREYINSTCRSEETIVSEIDKEKHQIAEQSERLRKELEFHLREDWREANGISVPQEPIKPVVEAPVEPEYRQAGLFNRKEVTQQNDALRAEYSAKVEEYNGILRSYEESMDAYKAAREEYERRQEEIFEQEKAAWETDPENVEKQKKLEELTARDNELDEMLKNPMEYAQKMLENSGPAKVKRLYEAEIQRNAKMLRKGYQTESDLQNVLFVFPKYLDILAVSKIYEYLVTGRVTSLTGANGAYTLYESEMRSSRAPGMSAIMRKTENAAREFTIYNALSSVSKIMNEIGDKTAAAAEELRTTNNTEACEEYNRTADAFYSLIDEDLKICREYNNRYNRDQGETVVADSFLKPGETSEEAAARVQPVSEEPSKPAETVETAAEPEETAPVSETPETEAEETSELAPVIEEEKPVEEEPVEEKSAVTELPAAEPETVITVSEETPTEQAE